MDIKNYKLNNGVFMPKIGIGTYPLKGQECYEIVLEALRIGYRLIDTATMYENEDIIGQAIRDSGIDRKELFITTKLLASIKNYNDVFVEFQKSLERLQLDYINLYLIHSPHPWFESKNRYYEENVEVYRALEDLYKAGKIRAIGVSNFQIKDLENILNNNTIKPQVNQISFYIGSNKEARYKFCKDKDILVQVHSPLARGALLHNKQIQELSKKYKVSVPNLATQYYLQKETCPILQTSKKERLRTNIEFDFEISQRDINILTNIKNIKRSNF